MGTSRDLTKYSLHTMLPATLDECQTSFQLENAVHFSSQDDQHITQPNPNLPNENFSTRKPWGRARKVKQPWDENILSFSTNFKTSSFDTKSAMTSLLGHHKLPQVQLLLDEMQNQRNACHLYSGDGIGYRMLTPKPYVCLVGWTFLLLNLWSLHSGSSHPPLQDLAEMLPVPIHSSTASHDPFSAARTSGLAYFSLLSSSNSDLTTSTATNCTLLHWICCP